MKEQPQFNTRQAGTLPAGIQWKMPFLAGCWCLGAALNLSAADVSVSDLGAKGDGKTDNTVLFQKALDTAGQSGGGTVFAGSGHFYFAGDLTIPDGVALEGAWKSVPAHTGMRNA